MMITQTNNIAFFGDFPATFVRCQHPGSEPVGDNCDHTLSEDLQFPLCDASHANPADPQFVTQFVTIEQLNSIQNYNGGTPQLGPDEDFFNLTNYSAPSQVDKVPNDAKELEIDHALTFDDINWLCGQGMGVRTNTLSLEEARQVCLTYSSDPIVDPTMPTTLEQKRTLVALIIHAIKSTKESVDSDDDTRMEFIPGRATAADIEYVAWKLVENLILRHTTGTCLTKSIGKTVARKLITGTFLDRFNKVIEALRTSHAITKHVLDSNYTESLVDDPQGALMRVLSNQKLNKKKCHHMRLGKAIEEENSPSPSKKQRKA